MHDGGRLSFLDASDSMVDSADRRNTLSRTASVG